MSIVQQIGRTPLVRLERIGHRLTVPIPVKCEHMNPGGSIKDRIALAIVEDAEQRGVLRSGMTLIEATTATEILEQTGGLVGAFVAGAGTGGTISGVGRRLKAAFPNVRIVLADPVGSALADWIETRTLGPDGSYAVEGIGGSEAPENLHRDVIRGSVFYPPSGIAARTLAPLDPLLSRMHAPGAAFLAIAADKARCSS